MDKKKTNKKFLLIFSTLFLFGGSYGIYKYLQALSIETTDDAQIEKNMNPIIPRVTGYLTKVYIKDNEFVKKGDTLFTIENNDYLVKLEDAKAALIASEGNYDASKADVGSANANIAVSNANELSAEGSIATAKIRLERASNDYERFNNLYKNHTITKQQFEQAQAAKQEAESQLNIVKQQQKASAFQKSVIIAKSNVSSKQTTVAAANIKRAQAMLDAAKLNLGYTIVTASIDGQVSKVSIQPGQLVQPGQSLFYIINNSETWVIANFKETQLDKMKMGQKVSIKVDAYPSFEFEGTISSFSPATGARFSMLPPDNATGNFVKTIQRLPVKISLDTKNDSEKIQLLRPGMNAAVAVHLK